MKKLKTIGKILIALGVLHLFRQVDAFYGFGGYVDNTWTIIFISLTLIIVGLFTIFFTNKILNN